LVTKSAISQKKTDGRGKPSFHRLLPFVPSILAIDYLVLGWRGFGRSRFPGKPRRASGEAIGGWVDADPLQPPCQVDSLTARYFPDLIGASTLDEVFFPLAESPAEVSRVRLRNGRAGFMGADDGIAGWASIDTNVAELRAERETIQFAFSASRQSHPHLAGNDAFHSPDYPAPTEG